LTINERKGDEIEDNYNSEKYQTAAKNILQAERSDKETREEGADDFNRRQERSWKLKDKRRQSSVDFDRLQEPSFQHRGEKETKAETNQKTPKTIE
jgi:hypothetical protein